MRTAVNPNVTRTGDGGGPSGFQSPLFRGRAGPWLAALALALLTVSVYLPAHRHPFFTMDDEQYVVNNAHLRDGLAPLTDWAFTSYDLANWHPATWFSHAADVRLFDLEPGGHHDVNVLLHAVNSLLL